MIRDQKWVLDEKYGGNPTEAYGGDLKRLASDEPVAYVIGSQPFLDLTIRLDTRPLIPRVETEWWVNELISSLPKDKPLSFLDLCSGSGAIGCAALSNLPNARVSFGEIEASHEATIRANIDENHLDASRASIGIGDLFSPFADQIFDVIASNPPYVPASRALPASVARYEPARALFAGEDGLDVIRRIAEELSMHLSKTGIAWIEIDRGHADAAAELFRSSGFITHIRTDQYGKPRIAVVSWPQ
ncbi:MAG TPA: peptide chain release factor N(5)-glutamine methyltransferase [Candidatus Paceibacterota bacterium]|nr:peptide chain release factor N(5)-glutamine methyltransferase [Candidatus Paceibacterota bacterium]